MPVRLRMSKSPQPGRRPPEPWVTGHFRRRIDPAALTGWAGPEGRDLQHVQRELVRFTALGPCRLAEAEQRHGLT